MPDITYQYSPNDEVYLIDACESNSYVTSGRVIRVRAEVDISTSSLQYDVQMVNSNVINEFNEEDIFVDKASAMLEYENRV